MNSLNTITRAVHLYSDTVLFYLRSLSHPLIMAVLPSHSPASNSPLGFWFSQVPATLDIAAGFRVLCGLCSLYPPLTAMSPLAWVLLHRHPLGSHSHVWSSGFNILPTSLLMSPPRFSHFPEEQTRWRLTYILIQLFWLFLYNSEPRTLMC